MQVEETSVVYHACVSDSPLFVGSKWGGFQLGTGEGGDTITEWRR